MALRLGIVDWAKRYFRYDNVSRVQGAFRPELCAFLCKDDGPLQGFASAKMRQGACMCSAQSAKTVCGQVCVSYTIAENPRPFLWVLPAQDEAVTFSKTRLKSVIERCEPIARLLPAGRHDTKNLEINFSTAPLILVGAGSGSKVSGKPCGNVFLDEEKDYAPGVVEKAIKRVRSFWDHKVWRMSTPSKKGDTIDKAFEEGDQRWYHIPCPACGESNPMRFRYFDEAHKQIGGIFYKLEGSRVIEVYYGCPTPGCSHRWENTPEDRYAMDHSGFWVRHNPSADPSRFSWTWNAFLPQWVDWKETVLEWLSAQRSLKMGDAHPLKVFFNETACEPYEEQMSTSSPDVKLTSGYSLKDMAKGERISGEAARVLTVDKQAGADGEGVHYWALGRAWSHSGASRLLFYRRCNSRQEVADLSTEYGIQPKHVFIDTGYDQTGVVIECSREGWFGIDGQDKDYFPITRKTPHGNKTEHRLYGMMRIERVKQQDGTVASANIIPLASGRLKDMLDMFRSGKSEDWQSAYDASNEYKSQMGGEQKRMEKNKSTGALEMVWVQTRANHAFDCETYQIAAALMMGVLRV